MAFLVEIESLIGRINEGSVAEADVTVTNTSSTGTETQTIRFETDGVQRDSQSVTLGAKAESRVQLEWQTTAPSDEGPYTATVLSDDDSDSQEFVVQNPIVRVTQGQEGPNSNQPWVEQRINEEDINERL